MWYPSSLFIYIINFFGGGREAGHGGLSAVFKRGVGGKINDR